MKYTVRQIDEGEDEVMLLYRTMTPEVERVYNFLSGEHIMISRTYASDFRKRLKGGADNE